MRTELCTGTGVYSVRSRIGEGSPRNDSHVLTNSNESKTMWLPVEGPSETWLEKRKRWVERVAQLVHLDPFEPVSTAK